MRYGTASKKRHRPVSSSHTWKTRSSGSSPVRDTITPIPTTSLSVIVEAATGRNYEGQLREQVYEPLGLKKTTLPAGPNLRAPYIHGYDNDPKEQPPEDYSELVAAGWAWASGAWSRRPPTSTTSSVATREENSSARRRWRGSVGSWREETPIHRVLGRTMRGWASSATRRGAGPFGATRATSSATPVHGGKPERTPLGDGVGKRAAHPDRGRTRGLQSAEARLGTRRVCRAGRPLAQRPVWTVEARALWRFGCPIHPAWLPARSSRGNQATSARLRATPRYIHYWGPQPSNSNGDPART